MIVVSYFIQSCEVFDAITKFFAFQFCGQKYCFARATEDADNAFLCKENHDLMDPYRMKDEFVNWLKVQYHMDFDGLSFRIALSSFFRIYGKDNTDERRPLRGIPGQDMEKSIALLVALFDRNKDIPSETTLINIFT